MKANINDIYLIKAIDNYPYDLPETIESLNYALSYDDKNPLAYELLGRIYAEQFNDFLSAKEYFEQALAIDIDTISVYPYFILTLIQLEEYKQAKKLIKFAFTLKGINKLTILLLKIHLFEIQGKFKKANKEIKSAKFYCFNTHSTDHLTELEKRIKAKRK